MSPQTEVLLIQKLQPKPSIDIDSHEAQSWPNAVRRYLGNDYHSQWVEAVSMVVDRWKSDQRTRGVTVINHEGCLALEIRGARRHKDHITPAPFVIVWVDEKGTFQTESYLPRCTSKVSSTYGNLVQTINTVLQDVKLKKLIEQPS